ncbi:unannotated protein [freshwater metagenome]|uniref:Unannotated protein n=1 Tax=freshwater metagenome TaxID=449393 RepID=A0A6J6FSZ0_9ZZZZ
MRISGRVARGLILSLVIALTPVAAVSAQKITPGAICKVLNQKVFHLKKTYTCTKSGTRLIWNKGVVAKPTPTPTSTPLPTPTSTPLPTPTTSPTPTPTGPANKITLDNLDPVWTSVVAFKEVNDRVINFDSSKLNISYIIGPGVDPQRVLDEKAGIDRIAGLWSPYFMPEKVRFVYVSEKDSEWAERIIISEQLNSMLYQSITLMITQNGCGFALGARPGGVYTNIQCLATGQGLGNLQTGPHEYTHFFQYSNNSLPDYSPCWITEGMAHFYGNAVGYSAQDPNGRERLNMYIGQTYNYDRDKGNPQSARTLRKIFVEGSPEKVTALFRAIETPGGGGSPSSCYLLGGLAFEALTASFGQEKIAAFMTSFKSSKDWKANFQTTFGLDVSTFYQKMTPYLAYWGSKMP